ncbi:MAG: helix-turn-helix transcriptional regulator [Chloroflexi bacterium]|nr:helix-turn-helix transcriptional regulator [Chloroflexota bacterium]
METKLDINSLLPLTEATFFILLSLSPGPKHGYAILKDVHDLSHGRITFSTGTLYGALKRLLDQGWIVRSGESEGEEAETSRSRKEYELTRLGRKILSSETTRMSDLVQLAVSIQPKES